MQTDPPLVIAVDHPSLRGALAALLDELRAESGCRGRGPTRGRVPSTELIDRLAAEGMMRLGVMHDGRLIAAAAVDNDGTVALAVLAEFRRRSVADHLMRVLTERAAAIGYPTLRRFVAGPARLAG